MIGDQDRQTLEVGIQSLRAMGLDPLGEGRMLAAVIFTDLGLHYDAVTALTELERAGDPFNADLYLLKGEVLDRLGRLDEACEAFDRADALPTG